MLVEFEVGNYLSFKKPVRLSMVAATPFKEFEEENVFNAHRHRLLKSAAVYGANASGKTNLLKALMFMKRFLLDSARNTQSTDPINTVPFKLDSDFEAQPSRFQIVFILDDLQYRYGFEVDRKAVRAEWLFVAKINAEKPLFLREDDGIDVRSGFKEGKGFEQNTRDNALFLSTIDQMNGPIAKKILTWFNKLQILHGLFDKQYEKFTINMLQDKNNHDDLLNIVKTADLGIQGFKIDEEDLDVNTVFSMFTEKAKKELIASGDFSKIPKLSAIHSRYKDGVKSGSVTLDFDGEESEGTKKFFRIIGPLLDCLKNGYVVAIDELDAKLHPLLTRAIIRLFQKPEINNKNAQLIFGTHDTNLLQYGKFRRDQVWFTEKDQQEATDLYSLAEFKVRKDASYEKDYIRGRYGAIPYLGDFPSLLSGDHPDGQADKKD